MTLDVPYRVDECIVNAITDIVIIVWYHPRRAVSMMLVSSLLKGMMICFYQWESVVYTILPSHMKRNYQTRLSDEMSSGGDN